MTNQPEKKLDLGLLLGLFSTSAALWYYLYQTIVERTTAKPAEITLIPMAIAHYLSFIFLVLAFILLMDQGLALVPDRQSVTRIKINEALRRALLNWWAPLFVFAFTSLFLTRLLGEVDKHGWTLAGVYVSLTVAIIVICQWMLGIILIPKASWHRTMLWASILVIAGFIHVMVTSFMAADIQFTSDKNFYLHKDVVRFELRPKGYFFLPTIEQVDYSDHAVAFTLGRASSIDLSQFSEQGSGLLHVRYEPQVFWLSQDEYITILQTEK